MLQAADLQEVAAPRKRRRGHLQRSLKGRNYRDVQGCNRLLSTLLSVSWRWLPTVIIIKGFLWRVRSWFESALHEVGLVLRLCSDFLALWRSICVRVCVCVFALFFSGVFPVLTYWVCRVACLLTALPAWRYRKYVCLRGAVCECQLVMQQRFRL